MNSTRSTSGASGPMSVGELLRRYAEGERRFRGVDLSGADVGAANLADADLREASLMDANLRRADLDHVSLAGADLDNALLQEASLTGAVLTGARISFAQLVGADLTAADLRLANLSSAILIRARLMRADLSGADLRGASLKHALLSHANLRGAKLDGAVLAGADLTSADLSRAELSGADLSGATLSDTSFSRANLFAADLSGARLADADLSGANLCNTNLRGADFSYCMLRDANFSGAYLAFANLTGAALSEHDVVEVSARARRHRRAQDSGGSARFDGAVLQQTLLVDVDLAPLCDAEPKVWHQGPSAVDTRSVARSIHSPKLKAFLRDAGMFEIFVEYMTDCARTLDPGGVLKMLQSTFISYGGPDTRFAETLNDALRRNGVTTFFFAKDAVPGRKLHRLMREGVNNHDRVILICSEASLDRPGVLNEIAETLQREARSGGREHLIPITLDRYVFTKWAPHDPGLAQAIRDRVVADFEGADRDEERFNEGLFRLIAALKK
jgi:uncharacterized protein YjbI with pentapeptide repeats